MDDMPRQKKLIVITPTGQDEYLQRLGEFRAVIMNENGSLTVVKGDATEVEYAVGEWIDYSTTWES